MCSSHILCHIRGCIGHLDPEHVTCMTHVSCMITQSPDVRHSACKAAHWAMVSDDCGSASLCILLPLGSCAIDIASAMPHNTMMRALPLLPYHEVSGGRQMSQYLDNKVALEELLLPLVVMLSGNQGGAQPKAGACQGLLGLIRRCRE